MQSLPCYRALYKLVNSYFLSSIGELISFRKAFVNAVLVSYMYLVNLIIIV